MWPRDAYVGQRVVCVDGGPFHHTNKTVDPNLDGLCLGMVYTIRKLGIDPTHGAFVFWLSEIIRPMRGADITEVGYAAGRFKPVDESRLDVFREMLKRPGVWNRDENRKDVVRPETV